MAAGFGAGGDGSHGRSQLDRLASVAGCVDHSSCRPIRRSRQAERGAEGWGGDVLSVAIVFLVRVIDIGGVSLNCFTQAAL